MMDNKINIGAKQIIDVHNFPNVNNFSNVNNLSNVNNFSDLNCSKCKTSLSGVCIYHSKEKNNINNSLKNKNFNKKTYISVSMKNDNNINVFDDSHYYSRIPNSFPITIKIIKILLSVQNVLTL